MFNSFTASTICNKAISCFCDEFIEISILFSTLFTESFILPSISFICVIEVVLDMDNFLISEATTEKPLPSSPALEASMAAFNPRRFVCFATLFINEIILSVLSHCLDVTLTSSTTLLFFL